MSGLEIQEDEQRNALLVSRKRKAEDTIVDVNGEKSEMEHQHLFSVHVRLSRMSKY